MPYSKRMADLQVQIEELRAIIEEKRQPPARRRHDIEKLLSQLAKLRAEHTRLRMRLSVVEIAGATR